jgi:phytoene dehydrogenase-like protein
VGVRAGGETVLAGAVVLTADGSAASALSGLPLARPGLGVTTIYLAGDAPLLAERKLLLNAEPEGFVNYAVQISCAAPEYAPPGEHLFCATVIGVRPDEDAEVERRVRAELAAWFGQSAVAAQRLLSISRVEYAQFEQPAGFEGRRPRVRTEIAGLYLGGEVARSSSINGAMEAGEGAARAVIDDLQAPAT